MAKCCRSSPIWPLWRQYMLLGLLGIGCYNALLPGAQDLDPAECDAGELQHAGVDAGHRPAVLGHSRQPPADGRGFAVRAGRGGGDVARRLADAACSALCARRPVHGAGHHRLGLLHLAAVAQQRPQGEIALGQLLLAQIVFGLLWSGLFTAGEALLGEFRLVPGWPLLGSLLFIAGPGHLAYRFWGMGVQRATPAIAGFFGNLIPLFTALLSIPVLGETPHLYHALAFALIVTGIVVSSRK
jgi:hypothetical protein